MSQLGIRKRSTTLLAIAIALIGFTGAIARAVVKHQSRTEWVTINASDPPPPLPYPAVDASPRAENGN
jgi:hypothetical protein